MNPQDRTSKAERDHTKAVYQELQNIKNRGGRIFNTGTPWSKCLPVRLLPMPWATSWEVPLGLEAVYFLYGRLWHRHVDDCKAEIIKLRKRFNCGRGYCEDNGDKGYLARDLRRVCGLKKSTSSEAMCRSS